MITLHKNYIKGKQLFGEIQEIFYASTFGIGYNNATSITKCSTYLVDELNKIYEIRFDNENFPGIEDTKELLLFSKVYNNSDTPSTVNYLENEINGNFSNLKNVNGYRPLFEFKIGDDNTHGIFSNSYTYNVLPIKFNMTGIFYLRETGLGEQSPTPFNHAHKDDRIIIDNPSLNSDNGITINNGIRYNFNPVNNYNYNLLNTNKILTRDKTNIGDMSNQPKITPNIFVITSSKT